MNKKFIIFGIFILLLIAGGVFWWWQSGKELKELNKSLPEGIRVEKRQGQEVIVNKKEGYEIKVPKDWGGIKRIEYLGNELLVGAKTTEDWASISMYNSENRDLNLWLKEHFKENTLRFPDAITSIVGDETIGNLKVTKVITDDPEIGLTYFFYFQKDSKIYEIYSDLSEQSIRNVILNSSF